MLWRCFKLNLIIFRLISRHKVMPVSKILPMQTSTFKIEKKKNSFQNGQPSLKASSNQTILIMDNFLPSRPVVVKNIQCFWQEPWSCGYERRPLITFCEGSGFKSQHHKLHGHFFTVFVVKIVMFV